MRKRKITIYDISKEAGVSPSTVSRVLTGNVNVSHAKKQKVLELIKKYDFQPSQIARGLTNNSSRAIGFIVPDIKNPYFSNVFYEFESIAITNGYHVMLCNSQSDLKKESDLLILFRQKRVDGIVFMGGRIDNYNLDSIYLTEIEKLNEHIPIIVTSEMTESNLVQVFCEEKEATFNLVKALYKSGCKKIGIIGGNESVWVYRKRRRNIEIACRKLGIELHQECIIQDGFDFNSGYDCCQKYIKGKNRVDGLCCINDIVALGALKSLSENEVKVPKDLLLTGFDGTFISEVSNPSITTVEADYGRMAYKLFEIFINLIERKKVEIKNTIPMKVVERESTNKNNGS